MSSSSIPIGVLGSWRCLVCSFYAIGFYTLRVQPSATNRKDRENVRDMQGYYKKVFGNRQFQIIIGCRLEGVSKGSNRRAFYNATPHHPTTLQQVTIDGHGHGHAHEQEQSLIFLIVFTQNTCLDQKNNVSVHHAISVTEIPSKK